MARAATKISDHPRYQSHNGKPKRVLWQGDDDIFFNKRQIATGVRLLYFGRIDHGETFIVTSIKNYRKTKAGNILWDAGDTVKTPTIDDVVLRNERTGETTQRGFYSLSYHSNWRLLK